MNGIICRCGLVLATALVAMGFESEVDHALFSAAVHKLFGESFKSTLNSAMRERSGADLPVQVSATRAPLFAGYVYLTISNDPSDDMCTKSSITVGVPVNTCTVVKGCSYRVSIVEDTCEDATVQYFADTTCATLIKEKRLDTSAYTSCQPFEGDRAVEVAEGVTVALPVHHWKLHCTAQPTKPIPVQSSVFDLFEGAGECSNRPIGFVSIAQDVCFPVNDGQYSLAPRCRADTVSLAASMNAVCARPAFQRPLAGTCALVGDGLRLSQGGQQALLSGKAEDHRGDGRPDRADSRDESQDDDDHDHDHGHHGGQSGDESHDDAREGPSASHDDEGAALPLPEVTSYLASCAAPNTDYTALVSASQILQSTGDLYAGYLQNPARFTAVLQRAAAAGIGRAVTAQDVHIAAVSQAGPHSQEQHPHLHPSLTTAAARVAPDSAVVTLADSGLLVQYTVLAYSPTLSGQDVVSALQSAVASGAFDSALRRLAQEEGVASLADASSSEVTVATMSSGSDSESAGEGDNGSGGGGGMSPTAVAGILVAGVVVLVVLAAVLARCCCGGKAQETGGKADFDLLPSAPSPTVMAQPVNAAAVVHGGTHSRPMQAVVAVPIASASAVASAPPAQAAGKGTRAAEPTALQAHAYQV